MVMHMLKKLGVSGVRTIDGGSVKPPERSSFRANSADDTDGRSPYRANSMHGRANSATGTEGRSFGRANGATGTDGRSSY